MPASKLKSHLYYKQQADKRHLCPFCGKSLTSTYQLEIHTAVHHKDEIDPMTGKETKNGTSHIATDVMCDQVVELVRYINAIVLLTDWFARKNLRRHSDIYNVYYY